MHTWESVWCVCGVCVCVCVVCVWCVCVCVVCVCGVCVWCVCVCVCVVYVCVCGVCGVCVCVCVCGVCVCVCDKIIGEVVKGKNGCLLAVSFSVTSLTLMRIFTCAKRLPPNNQHRHLPCT